MSPSARDTSCSMAGSGSRRAYPDGLKRQMTPAWKDLVRARLGALGRSEMWLEQQLSRGKGTISRMLNEGNTSSLVDPICEILSIPEPLAEVRTADELEMLATFRRLSPAEQAHILGILKMSAPKTSE